MFAEARFVEFTDAARPSADGNSNLESTCGGASPSHIQEDTTEDFSVRMERCGPSHDKSPSTNATCSYLDLTAILTIDEIVPFGPHLTAFE